MKKFILIPLLSAVAVGSVLFTQSVVHAQQETIGVNSLIQRIAQRFNLDETQVTQVFEEHRQEHKIHMQQQREERLNQAVNDGLLNETQKQAIIEKHNELKDKHDADMKTMKEKTVEERRQLMENHKIELENWAKENDIPSEFIPMRGHGRGIKMFK